VHQIQAAASIEAAALLGADERRERELREQLATYFVGDRIRQIPARMQKRCLLAEWLSFRFERGQTYTEKDVNAIIAFHHTDFATLRREMIDHGFMQRRDGLYWRESEAGEIEARGSTTS
jgi:hypothetical protein